MGTQGTAAEEEAASVAAALAARAVVARAAMAGSEGDFPQYDEASSAKKLEGLQG